MIINIHFVYLFIVMVPKNRTSHYLTWFKKYVIYCKVSRTLLFFQCPVVKMPTKNNFFNRFFCFLRNIGTLTSFQIQRVIRNSQNCRNQDFKNILLADGRVRIRIRTDNYGSGSMGPKNIRVQGSYSGSRTLPVRHL
jgi:hypothetical protein